MSFRLMMLSSLSVLALAACSSTEDQDMATTADVNGQYDTVNQGGLDNGYDSTYDTTGVSAGVGAVDSSVVPGSQQDLVVNVGDRVFFGYDQYDLSSEARSTLDRQAQWLNQYPSLNITIEGHADERGTREYNIALGDRRATAVKNYLISLGISASRINTISYGKEKPAVIGANPGSWAQNRRSVTRVD